VTSLLFFAAGAAVCLAAFLWLVLIGARALRIEVSRRSKSSRTGAAQALARFENDRDGGALAKALAPMQPDILAATLARRIHHLDPPARSALRDVLTQTGFHKHARARLRSAPEGTRLLYCELLGEIPGKSAVSLLERALKDRSPLVRMGAAMSLARLGAAPPLRDLLARLGPRACASSRLTLLFELLLAEQGRELVEIAVDPTLPARIRLSALQAMALAGHDQYPRLLPTLAGDGAPPVAAEVARSLPAARVDAAPALLGELLAHPSRGVRREAAQAAGTSGAAVLKAPLRRLLLDRDPTVASRAARSLSERAGEARSVPAGEAQ
jgi:HEAT repeat protein